MTCAPPPVPEDTSLEEGAASPVWGGPLGQEVSEVASVGNIRMSSGGKLAVSLAGRIVRQRGGGVQEVQGWLPQEVLVPRSKRGQQELKEQDVEDRKTFEFAPLPKKRWTSTGENFGSSSIGSLNSEVVEREK